MTTIDPRALGFNYGAALPLPKPGEDLIFDIANGLSDRLDTISHDASERAWTLSEAIRAYRHATTAEERNEARAKLDTVHSTLYPLSPTSNGDPAPNYSFQELADIGIGQSTPGTVSRSTYPDDNFDRHGNRRTTKPVDKTLGRTLAAYVSPEDEGLRREEFLRSVRSRIDLDLRDGAPNQRDNADAAQA